MHPASAKLVRWHAIADDFCRLRCGGADDRPELAESGLSQRWLCPDVVIDGDDRSHAGCAPFISFAVQSSVPRAASRTWLCSLIACHATVVTQVHAEITTRRFVHPT